jgi:PST family polysaccharide transporter
LLGPAFAVVIVVAPDLVPVAFGSKWHAAVVPVQLLSLAGLAQTVVAPHWSILTALDRPGTLLRVNLLVTAVTIAAFVAGLPFGIVGVAGFYAAARWLLLVVDTAMTTRAVSYPFWQSLHAGLDSLPVAVAAGAAGLGVRLLLVHADVPQVARLFAAAAVICGSYVLFLSIAMPRTSADLWATIRRRPT